MKLTVDASIVVKWFVTEPRSEEARQLLTPRIRVHRREIPDPQPYLEELASLSEVVKLRSSGDVLERAVRIALEMDHPVYDCLYLACAEATSSVLITADHRFAKKAAGATVDVWSSGRPLSQTRSRGRLQPRSSVGTRSRS